MLEKLTHLELADGGRYPLKCDLAVLEAAQEEYGKLSIFERELSGLRKTGKKDKGGNDIYSREEPSVKAVRFALPLMINEGIDLENRRFGEKRKHFTEKDLSELLEGINIFEVAGIMHQEFVRCFEVKNPKSTQEEEKKSR